MTSVSLPPMIALVTPPQKVTRLVRYNLTSVKQCCLRLPPYLLCDLACLLGGSAPRPSQAQVTLTSESEIPQNFLSPLLKDVNEVSFFPVTRDFTWHLDILNMMECLGKNITQFPKDPGMHVIKYLDLWLLCFIVWFRTCSLLIVALFPLPTNPPRKSGT